MPGNIQVYSEKTRQPITENEYNDTRGVYPRVSLRVSRYALYISDPLCLSISGYTDSADFLNSSLIFSGRLIIIVPSELMSLIFCFTLSSEAFLAKSRADAEASSMIFC